MRDNATIGIETSSRCAADREILEYVERRVVGRSEWARSAPALVATHAAHARPLLVEGETGVGKQLVARLVHECGPRSARPFFVVDSATLGDDVLLAILFDAPESLSPVTRELQREFVEQARGGTLYLPDVAALSPETARKAVRSALHPDFEHARRRSPLGRSARLILGATAPVAPAPASGTAVRVPSLRERPEDVEPLGDLFAFDACRRLGKEPRALSPGALASLRAHGWPGNVGELKRVVEMMVRRSGPPLLDASLLPRDVLGASRDPLSSGISLHEEVQRYEVSLLVAALERCYGVQTHAAHMLGMKVSTLNSKLAHHDIDASAFKPRRSA